MLWVLVWAMSLAAAIISFIAMICFMGRAFFEDTHKDLLFGIGAIFLTIFFAWASWAASFMS